MVLLSSDYCRLHCTSVKCGVRASEPLLSLSKQQSSTRGSRTMSTAAVASAGPVVAANGIKRFIYGLGRRSCHLGSVCGSIPIRVHNHSILKPNKLLGISPSAIKLSQMGLKSISACNPVKSINRTPKYGEIRAVSAKVGDLENLVGTKRRCIVLDIEGTTTPISFVFDVLFPYARDNVGRHLTLTYDTSETQDDIELLRAQVQEDLKLGVDGAVPIPSDDEGKEKVIAALVANVNAMIKADRKITALKQLQGHIWRTGFQNNELVAIVFEDVPEALERWHATGIKVYIYSSGSRLAQRLIFGNTNFGDLRKYLCAFFDTMVGNKRETRSYIEISESVGVDHPSEVLFITDVYQEAVAAKAAGLEVVISIRPGNGPLPENHGFKTITSFAEL